MARTFPVLSRGGFRPARGLRSSVGAGAPVVQKVLAEAARFTAAAIPAAVATAIAAVVAAVALVAAVIAAVAAALIATAIAATVVAAAVIVGLLLRRGRDDDDLFLRRHD